MVISGDTYFDRGSMLTLVQGYIYDNTIISYSVNNLGVTKIDHLYAINVNGYLTFWFSRINYWQSYKVEVYRSSAGNYRKNHAISVVNSEKPEGTKEIDLCGNKFTNAYISDLTWGNIRSKPETSTRWPSWSEITSKPSTFTPSDHSHNYLPLSGGTLTGELDVNNILKICEPNDPLAGKIHTKLLCYSSSPYGIIFRGYASGTHSIQVQRESNDSERFNLSLQPLGGNVGIGTTSPGARLEVNGGVHLNSSGSEQNIDFRKDGSYRNEISSNGTNFVLWSNTTGDGNGWRQDLVIRRSDGYVGIGTDNPTNKLHIVGSTKHEGTIVLENSAYFLGAPSYGFRFNDHNSNYNNFIIYENGNTYTRGNVGIGTTSPSYKLDVNGSANATTLYENASRVITTANIGSQNVAYATNSTKVYASDNPYRYGDSSPYYAYFTYNTNSDNRWYLRVYPETPKTIAVDYSYNADCLDGYHETGFQRATTSTIRDFVNGTLITTDIDYSVGYGDPFYMEIKGNTYGRYNSCFTQVQGYIYDNTIIHYGVSHLGVYHIDGIIAINVSGNLCFWFPRQGYWEGYSIAVYSAYNYRVNRVTSVTDSSEPSGTKRVNLASNTHYTITTLNISSSVPSLSNSEIDNIIT